MAPVNQKTETFLSQMRCNRKVRNTKIDIIFRPHVRVPGQCKHLYLAKDSFDVDGQVSMWTPKATHDAKAEPLRALFQSDALWLGRSVTGHWFQGIK